MKQFEFIKRRKLLICRFSVSIRILKKILPEEYIVQIQVYDCIFHLHPSIKNRNRVCYDMYLLKKLHVEAEKVNYLQVIKLNLIQPLSFSFNSI